MRSWPSGSQSIENGSPSTRATTSRFPSASNTRTSPATQSHIQNRPSCHRGDSPIWIPDAKRSVTGTSVVHRRLPRSQWNRRPKPARSGRRKGCTMGADESLFRRCVVRGASAPGVPEIVPILSRGKHRNSRKGACFMEMASYLAGERWSDHPKCTHPLLAMVARLVNDNTSDDHRSRLTELIPSVIGLTTTDRRADVPHRAVLRHGGAANRISQASERDGRVRARRRAGARCTRRTRARHIRPQEYRGARQCATRSGVGTAVRGAIRVCVCVCVCGGGSACWPTVAC